MRKFVEEKRVSKRVRILMMDLIECYENDWRKKTVPKQQYIAIETEEEDGELGSETEEDGELGSETEEEDGELGSETEEEDGELGSGSQS